MIVRRAQPWLGTLVEIVAEGDDAASLIAAVDRAFARVAAVHAAMSFQEADSELSRVNREAQHGWVELSPDLAAVYAAALDVARISDGLFNPSVACWLVDSGHLPQHPDTPLHAQPDWRAIAFDGSRVHYACPLLVDLSGIAKGYAVDAALAILREAGLTAATVNAGGDLARFGETATPVHVRHPHHPTHTLRLAELRDGAAATSAGYFQPDALRHPRTGESLCAATSVTVLAKSCMTADALTKVVAADPARAAGVLARYGAEAIVLDAKQAMFCDADGWRPLATEPAA
jgi:thiamine biosynthesis lipoprotein